MYVHIYIYIYTYLYDIYIYIYIYIYIQPIADRLAPNLEILSKDFQLSTPIFKGFISGTMILPGTTRESHGQNSGMLMKFLK